MDEQNEEGEVLQDQQWETFAQTSSLPAHSRIQSINPADSRFLPLLYYLPIINHLFKLKIKIKTALIKHENHVNEMIFEPFLYRQGFIDPLPTKIIIRGVQIYIQLEPKTDLNQSRRFRLICFFYSIGSIAVWIFKKPTGSVRLQF